MSVAGRTIDPSTVPVPDVAIAAFDTSNQSLATATTDSAGLYGLSLSTGGTPFSAYLRGTKASYVNTYYYPAAPIAADLAGADLPLLTTIIWGLLPTIAQATQTSGTALLLIRVLDCLGSPVAGAFVSTTPGGEVVYGLTPSTSATMTGADGYAWMFSVPVGTVTVGATKMGTTLRSHDVVARADVLTTVDVRP